MRTSSFVFLFACLAALTGCGDYLTAPRSAVQLRFATVGDRFARDGEGWAAVPFVLENQGDEPVTIDTCGAPSFQRWQTGAWEHYAGGVCTQVGTHQMELAPGQTYQGTAGVGATGVFRLHVLLRENAGPAGSVESNGFVVE